MHISREYISHLFVMREDDQDMTEASEQETVWVRCQSNDWKHALYRVDQIKGLHMGDNSGGVNPRQFLHGFVWCDEMIEGELAHSCNHYPEPHQIRVCIVKVDNQKSVYEKLAAQTN